MSTLWPGSRSRPVQAASYRRRQVAKLPVNLSKVRDAWSEISALTERSAGILLAGDQGLVSRAQERLTGEVPLQPAWRGGVRELSDAATYPGELLLVFVPAAEEAAAQTALQDGRQEGGVVLAVDEGSAATGVVTRSPGGRARVSFSDTDQGWRAVFAACAQVAGKDLLALARRYPALRKTAAQRVVNQTAAQNALIGLLVFIPGADMPAMTMNQAKMMLQLAAIHGERVDMDRALELVATVGLGFGFRGVARSLVGMVPGFGWLFKALVAYLTTSSLGSAAAKYYDSGAPASTSRAIELVNGLRR